VERRLGEGLLGQLRRSWRSASVAMLALLVGFFLAQNVTTLLLGSVQGGRPAVVLAVVVVIELLVRLRSRWLEGDPPLAWVVVDNFRLGATYAVVLEAFKLGT
jgi:hypothetical protein